MSAPPIIKELVARFEQNREAYRAKGYNETQLRREFVDPFFEALGWDITNKKGHAEAYKDVIHEDAIKIGGVTKAPDYCFRIGGARKFFVEAKKPSVSIKDGPSPAYQLRRYAWSAKLPLSILTDFEELAVYDCRIRPNLSDKPSAGRIRYLTFTQYLDQWDEIVSVFSKDAVLKGSFDKYAVAEKNRGTATVDAAFLAEIEAWREALAKNLALRNPRLDVHNLNFAVQRTIDRIIFLRICEDRGVEQYGQLQVLLNGENVYGRLKTLYYQADDRYNSGLFHFQTEKDRTEAPDRLTLDLKIDDKVLKEIIRHLYYPDSPYEFSVLPIEILGQVYEQFLGKVIRLTKGHQAKIEDKPELKKAGGVYYTPAYIVEYIVINTVGKLCEGKTPRQIAQLRILDPACGSGSFLIGAYEWLLSSHRDWYVKDGAERHQKEIYRGPGGQWHLTTPEKKRILINNIYGVDIDSQAVEVTKLSLLLKVLEGETDESLRRQLTIWKERALPDLGKNIKCGNSLIGPDYFEGQLLPDEEEVRRINAFDFMDAGAFDAIIGNPPYVRQETLSGFKDYFARHFEAFDGIADLYAYFMERAVKLLREGGRFSFIVSSSFLRTTYGSPLRRTLKKHAAVLRIVDFGGLPVFENAKDTYVCIPLLAKVQQPAKVEVCRIPSLLITDLNDYVLDNRHTIPHERLASEAWSLKSDEEAGVFQKILRAGKPLGDYAQGRFFRGVTTGLNNAFVIDTAMRNTLIAKSKLSSELIKPLLAGEHIKRYRVEAPALWLIFTRRGVDIGQYPAIRHHLSKWRPQLTPKKSSSDTVGRKPGTYEWYEIQDDVAYYQVFDAPKIIFPDICKEPRFVLDRSGTYLSNTAYALGANDPYLLAILNSRLFWFAISNISIPFGVRAGKYRYRLIYQYMEKVPIRWVDFADKADRAKHSRLVELAEDMMRLHQKEALARPPDKEPIRRRIELRDREIDRLVYGIYGLTEQDIEILEKAIASTPGMEENGDCEETTEPLDRLRESRQLAEAVAAAPRYADEGGGGASKSPARAGDAIDGVREPTRQYGAPPDPPEEPDQREGLGSTRYFETAEGRLSYSELSERLAIPLVGLLDEVLQTPADQIIITGEWICLRHKRLAGHLFPDWAGRYRDLNIQVGSHTPPPFYEVPILMRQYCEDLAERLRRLVGSEASALIEFLAWTDWRFQWIHPFRDFNGRIGRVLLAALLYTLRLPHVETAPVQPEHRQTYLHALRSADAGNLEPLQLVWYQRLIDAL